MEPIIFCQMLAFRKLIIKKIGLTLHALELEFTISKFHFITINLQYNC